MVRHAAPDPSLTPSHQDGPRRLKDAMRRRVDALANFPPLTLDAVMQRRRDVQVRTVIDVGASNGCWSQQVMSHFPEAFYFLVEARTDCWAEDLKAFKAKHANVDFVLCAAGDHDG